MGSDTIDMSYTPLPEQVSACTDRKKKCNVPLANELFFTSEIASSCGCMNGLIKFSNLLYRFGYLFTFSLLIIISLIVAPVFGFVAALLEWACMIVRLVARPIGRLLADLFGVGTIIALKSEQIKRELDV